ncbi:LOW QUALITY PROTEIN: uncharacterized protein J5F26_012705 [Ciconia maguari]
MSATIAKPELVKLPAGANHPGAQRQERWPWGALSSPGTKLWHTGAGGSQRHPATPYTHGSSWEGELKGSGVSAVRKQQGSPFVLPSLTGQRGPQAAAGLAGRSQAKVCSRRLLAKHPKASAGAEGSVPGRKAASPLLFPALPRTPSVRQEAGAGAEECHGPGLHLPASCSARRQLGKEGDASLASARRRGAGSAYGDWRGIGGVIPPSVSPFSVSPVRETLRWQSRARRPLEVGGVWPSSALPPSIVSGSERWRRWRAPAPAAGGRDAPALRGRAGRLWQSRRHGFGAAAGISRGPEEGDAACACLAQLPPREMNMSLPGRVSCSMLNCFQAGGLTECGVRVGENEDRDFTSD